MDRTKKHTEPNTEWQDNVLNIFNKGKKRIGTYWEPDVTKAQRDMILGNPQRRSPRNPAEVDTITWVCQCNCLWPDINKMSTWTFSCKKNYRNNDHADESTIYHKMQKTIIMSLISSESHLLFIHHNVFTASLLHAYSILCIIYCQLLCVK